MDNLQFQDFEHVTVNSTNSDYRPPGQVGDQAQLFTNNGSNRDQSNPSQKRNFFSFEFYQQYFDVDTEQVFSRILNSMVPKVNSNFIIDHIQPFPDLYGPFWISITLIFTTAICGNLAKYIESSGDVINQQYGSDFRLVTGASTIIFCYVVLVPCILFSIFWYRKSEIQYSYLDLLCAYGYSLSIFIPVSILWVMQMQWFRWLLIIVSVLLSGSVLVSSIWPAIRNDRNRMFALGTIIGILFLHTMLAVGFKEYYFDASQPSRLRMQVGNIEHVDLPLTVAHPEIAKNQSDSANPKTVLQAANQIKDAIQSSTLNAQHSTIKPLATKEQSIAPKPSDSSG